MVHIYDFKVSIKMLLTFFFLFFPKNRKHLDFNMTKYIIHMTVHVNMTKTCNFDVHLPKYGKEHLVMTYM